MDEDVTRLLEIESTATSTAIDEAGPAPERIGGWLILPAIGLVLGALLSVAGLLIALGLAPRIPAEYLGVFILDLVCEALLTTFIIYAAIRFFGKKRNAPKIMIAMMVANAGLYGLLLAINLAADAGPFALACGKNLARSVIGAAIWIPYFLVSKRVKRTFVLP